MAHLAIFRGTDVCLLQEGIVVDLAHCLPFVKQIKKGKEMSERVFVLFCQFLLKIKLCSVSAHNNGFQCYKR